jgi:beta-fructofuranosidase
MERKKQGIGRCHTLLLYNEYHIFYLNANDDGSGWARSQTPWSHLVTKDLIHYTRLPDVINQGNPTEHDGHACFTGSVIVKDGIWHIFYTGFSPLHPQGREKIMHATSRDGIVFEKDENNPFLNLDSRLYGADEDWRDPCVFWDEEENCYFMTITTGSRNPISNCQRGVIGLARFYDLNQWEVLPPIYNPESYMPMECSDPFKMDGKWYMIFSQYGFTEYRYADCLKGPWYRPKNPVLDGGEGYFYAAKTLFDGKRRLLWGWCGTQEGGKDSRSGQWGGELVSPRELYLVEDGKLGVRLPEELLMVAKSEAVETKALLGNWREENNRLINTYKSGFSVIQISDNCEDKLIHLKINADKHHGTCGILLNAAHDLSSYYYCRIDTGRKTLEVIRNGFSDTVYGAVVQGIRQMACVPVTFDGRTFDLKIILKKNIAEIFLNDKTSITMRFSDFQSGILSLVADDLSAEFEVNIFNISL